MKQLFTEACKRTKQEANINRVTQQAFSELSTDSRPEAANVGGAMALAHLRLTYEVRVFLCIFDGEVCEFDVEVLIDRMEYAAQLQFVLQFDDDFLPHQRLEKLKEMLEGEGGSTSNSDNGRNTVRVQSNGQDEPFGRTDASSSGGRIKTARRQQPQQRSCCRERSAASEQR
jgi:hypothetical protein